MVDSTPSATTGISAGAVVTTTYVERQMKAYAVYEDEVNSLSYLNTQSTIFFAVSASFISFAVSIWINAIFYTDLTPAGQIASGYIAWMLLLIGIIFAALAAHAVRKRATAWRSIIRGSTSR
jgi:hypothetical protein